MTEQLFLFEPDVTVLRPVEIEGYRRGRVSRMGGIWKVRYWNCACGQTLHYRQVVKHLVHYHFYPESFARFAYQRAKLGLPQFLPTLANLLTDAEGDETREETEAMKPQARKTYISPPDSCDVCDGRFEGVMFDARIPGAGSWANLCGSCFDRFGCELGIGRGQKYVEKNGAFVKVAG